jgi:hypothetical protein
MQLRPIEHRKQRILTTQQIADFYEANPQRIINNFNRNKDRYVEGKHFFLLEGESLETFKTSLEIADKLEATTHQNDEQSAETTTQIELLTKGVNKLYLWTEKGALIHAKSLNTDKAWERYEELVDDYYRRGDQLQSIQAMLALNTQLAELHKRLNNLPSGLGPSELDRAEGAANSLYRLFAQNLSHISIFHSENKITDEQWKMLIKTLEKMIEPMATLHVVVNRELELDDALTDILFDYRDILRALAPEHKMLSLSTIEEHKQEERKLLEGPKQES